MRCRGYFMASRKVKRRTWGLRLLWPVGSLGSSPIRLGFRSINPRSTIIVLQSCPDAYRSGQVRKSIRCRAGVADIS